MNTVSSCKYQLLSVRHTNSYMYKNKLAFWTTRPHKLPFSSTHPTNPAKAAKLKVSILQKQRIDRLADLQIQNSSTGITCKINTMAELSDAFKSSWDHFLGSIIPFVKIAVGTGSVWKANSQAHLLRNILFSVYLKRWRGAQNRATPSAFSQHTVHTDWKMMSLSMQY